MYDALVVGGGPAGLSAALLLGRSRRSVLVCDGGEPRNQPAAFAHSFLTRDGVPPAELRAIAVEQMAAYPRVELAQVTVVSLAGAEGEFFASLSDGREISARIVIFATGVRDALPSIPGLAELWGSGVIHCPYCDGWERQDEPLALLQNDEHSAWSSVFHRQWSRDFALFTNGPAVLTEAERAELSAKGVAIHEGTIERLERTENGVKVVFSHGGSLTRRAIFVRPAQEPRTELARSLGCAIVQDDPARPLIQIDHLGRTTVPGVLACGDVAIPMQHLAEVVGSGSTAGVIGNYMLVVMDRAAESAALGLPPLEEPA